MMPLVAHAQSAFESGGGKETRTPDIQLAKLALYQLSYTPVRGSPWGKVVRLSGLEPETSRLSGGCSNQLSYRRIEAPVGWFRAKRNPEGCGSLAQAGHGIIGYRLSKMPDVHRR